MDPTLPSPLPCYGPLTAHCAAQEGHLPCVQHLVQAGANLEARNRFGNTPLNIAGAKAGAIASCM